MTAFMTTELMTMAEVIRRLRTVPRHRITFALDRGFLPEPARISGRRMFTQEDLVRIQEYFRNKGAKDERTS